MRCSSVRWRTGVIVVLVALVVAACGSDRPTVEVWETSWYRISSGIPDESALSESATLEPVCTETLVFLRVNRAELTPTPDLAIDDVVNAWIEIAEDAFFECPPSNEKIADFAEAYAELSRLEAEIELVLDIDRAE
jgi:hypothetical protein